MKKNISILLICSLMISILFISSDSIASSKTKTVKYSVTLYEGYSQYYYLSNVKKSNISSCKVKSSNKKVSIKKDGKIGFTIIAKKSGKSTVTATLKLKKAVAKKKLYKFVYKVKILKSLTPSPTEDPNKDFNQKAAKKGLIVEKSIQYENKIMYQFTNNYIKPMTYNLKLSLYSGDLMMDSMYIRETDGNYELVINPGETQYYLVEVPELDNYTLKEEKIVSPIDYNSWGGDVYRPTKSNQYSIKHGKTEKEYVINITNKANRDLTYLFYLVEYTNGNISDIIETNDEVNPGETAIERINLEEEHDEYIDDDDSEKIEKQPSTDIKEYKLLVGHVYIST